MHLTLDQLPLFVVNSFKGTSRTLSISIKLDDETTVEQTFSVGASAKGKIGDGKGRGVLKQAHQDAFYRLLWKWGELGYPLAADGLGELTMTVGALVKLISGDDAEHRYARANELVRDLSSIPVSLANVHTRSGLMSVEEFTLVHLMEWSERSVDTKTRAPRAGGHSLVRILFSRVVTDGFLIAEVKALLLGVYDSLGAESHGRHAEVARLLYPILDHELASKRQNHVSRVADQLSATKYDLLVNNAGYGLFGRFPDQPLEKHLTLMRVNMNALVTLAHVFLAHAKPGDALVNVSSGLTFSPMPAAGVYTATKAFVTVLSECLWYEQKARDVYVLGLHPGPTTTEFQRRSGSDQLTPPKLLVQTADEVVGQAMAAQSIPVAARNRQADGQHVPRSAGTLSGRRAPNARAATSCQA